MGTPRRIYLLFLADLTHDGLITMQRGDGWPEAKMAAKTLAAGMRDPAWGQPRRPRVLQAPTQRLQEMLAPACAAWGIELRLAPLPPKLHQMYADFKSARSQDDGSLLQIRGMSPNLLERLYQAAAGFHAAAPWLLLPSENAVCVEAPTIGLGPRVAVAMGQGGQTQGLVLYENAALVRRLWRDDLDMDEVMECSRGLSLSFEHEDHIPLSELEEAKARGWPLVDEDNCPSVLYKLPGSDLRQPTLAELELLEACLRVLPSFYAAVRPDDFAEQARTAVLAGRDCPLKLRWLDWR